MTERLIEQGRVEVQDRDEAARGEGGSRPGQDGVVGSNEVEGLGEVPALDQVGDPWVEIDLPQRKQAETTRWDELAEPGRRGDAQPAVAVVEEGAGSVHGSSLRFPSRSPSATLWP